MSKFLNRQSPASFLTIAFMTMMSLIIWLSATQSVPAQNAVVNQLTGNNAPNTQPAEQSAASKTNQVLSAATDEALNAFLESARQTGARVIVVDPSTIPVVEDKTEMTMSNLFSADLLLRARKEFRFMWERSLIFAPTFFKRLERVHPDGGYLWLLRAIATAVGGLVIGNWVFRYMTRWSRAKFGRSDKLDNLKREEKLAIILRRAVFMLFSTLVAMLVALLIAILFDSEHEASRRTIFIIVTTYTAVKIMRSVVFWNFFLPDNPHLRFVNLDDQEARRLFRDWAISLTIVGFIILLARLVGSSDMNNDFETVVRILGLLICAIILAIITISHRHELYKIVIGPGDPENRPQWLKIVGIAMTPIMLLYLAASWLISAVRLTLGLPGGFLPLSAPFLVFVVALFVYAAGILLLEKLYVGREANFRKRQLARILAERRAWQRTLKSREIHDGLSDAQKEIRDENEDMAFKMMERPIFKIQKYVPVFKSFFERVLQALLLVFSLGELSRLWGIDVGRDGGHPIASTLDVILVTYVAYAAYGSVNDWIDYKIVAEGGRLETDHSNPAESDSEGGTGESRVATLLPIFRNVFAITIFAIACVSVLSYLGVNVGPLFAGAGVVGLAVGFGAQTLIRDIFSGAFFLVDDAFRKGEYIEIEEIRGVVEKISMRSFQLRHHLGAVHTIPFGEIKHLTNYSRDWVMMKLPMRVTYDTDVEKVRKLVKKLGQELLKDEIVGPLFLQPLKSQGVYKMEDSAMIIRVKFMTRPGDQFVTRKVVYAAVRDMFEKEGIRFAHREVTVHLAGDKHADQLTDEQRKAVIGSVQATLQDDELLPPDKSLQNAL